MMRFLLLLATVLLVAGLAAAASTRYLGLQETGQQTLDENFRKLDAAIGARPTTTTTSSSTSTSTSTSSSTSTSTSTSSSTTTL
jgi:hypothetical protein